MIKRNALPLAVMAFLTALLALTLALTLSQPSTASVPANRTVAQVLHQARTIYGLPATSAVCWSTGHATFSCQLFGPREFRAIATGTVIGGTTEAVFS